MAHTVQLPDDLYQQAAAYAAEQHETPDEVILNWVRQAAQQIKTQTAPSLPEAPVYTPENDPLAPFIGQFASGDPHLAKRHHEYLAEAYADAHQDERND